MTYSFSFAKMKGEKSLISDIVLTITFKCRVYEFCILNALHLIHGLSLLSGFFNHQ